MSADDSPTVKPPPIQGLKILLQRVFRILVTVFVLIIIAWRAFAGTNIPYQVSRRFCDFVNSNSGINVARRLSCSPKTTWHFALVVPSEPDLAREKILRAKKLIEDEFKDGVAGHPIEIKVYNDAVGGVVNEMTAKAEDNANQIIQDHQALVVIGHFYSPASSQAGPIYERNKIPVITASSGAPEVTKDNPWYFRVINNNNAMGGYAGLYAHQILKYQTASIVYVDTNFGQSLRDAFEKAFVAQGGEIIDKEPVKQQPELNEAGQRRAEELVKKFAEGKQEPDVIFLAINNKEVFQFALAMEAAGKDYPLLDAYDQGDSTFSQWFNEQLKASGRTGRFPDKMYAFTPISYDAAGGAAQNLLKVYRERYDEEPGWLTATTYDALKIAILAAKNTAVEGTPEKLAEERKNLQAYLARWNKSNPPPFISELTRPIYFDDDRNYPVPPMFGYFEEGRFLSAPIQLSREMDQQTADAFVKAEQQNPPIETENNFVFKTNVVYTDIHINQITNVDVDKDHQFTADFFIWFIFDPTVNIKINDIEFTNALAAIPLDAPLSDVKLDDHREYQLYRVRSQFRTTSDLAYYPFDNQNLLIEFRHKSLTSDYLIYAQDILGQNVANDKLTEYFTQQHAFDNILGDWKPQTIEVGIESRADTSRLGNRLLEKADQKVENSTFSFTIQITRNPARFVVKNLLPLFFLMVLTYLALFLPGYKFETVTQLLTGTVLSVVFLHVDLSRRLNVGYIVALDVVFYATYLVLVLELLISIIAWRNHEPNPQTAKRFFWFMRVLYPAYFLLAGAIFILLFDTTAGKNLMQQYIPTLFK